VVAVPLARFPELERPGGAVKVVLGDASLGERRAVFLRHDGEGAYRGFSAVCTHQGCLVDVTPQGFRCPCHGSLYDLDGRNAAGPARRPLAPFRAERRGDAVNLFLTSG
jgi:Rieske Fe-S protein